MAPLTPREREVLALVGRGMRCREIAATLGMAVFTVRKHRSNILGKLGLHSTAQLVARAVQMYSLSNDARNRSASAAPSRREQQVMLLVAEGLTSKEIAKRLGISPATVRKHREYIYVRLGIRGMAEMILCADTLRSEDKLSQCRLRHGSYLSE